MNWTHFLLWLAGGYALYYLIVILSDLARSTRQVVPGTAHELTFSERVTPVQLAVQAAETNKPKDKPEVIGSGGVPITDLFRLAKQEAIIYTRGVSF